MNAMAPCKVDVTYFAREKLTNENVSYWKKDVKPHSEASDPDLGCVKMLGTDW